MLEWLIRHGAKVEKDDLGGTPLHDAAEHGQKNVQLYVFSIEEVHRVDYIYKGFMLS